MKKISLRKIHKLSGLTAGLVLLILAFTGLFLNHKNWNFLYSMEVSNSYLPSSLRNKDLRLLEAYIIDDNTQNILYGSKKGLYLKTKNSNAFEKVLNVQVLAIKFSKEIKSYFAATSNGLYVSKDYGLTWKQFFLEGKYINALAVYENQLLVSVDKKELILLDINKNIIFKTSVNIKKEQLNHSINLSRLVRDLHYGRGLFDNGWSLFLNDFATIWLMLSVVTGFLIWFIIRRIKQGEKHTKLLKRVLTLHISSVFLIALIPLLFLIGTGVFLDHSKFFRGFLTSIKIDNSFLPPIYRTLKEDIWSVDIYKNKYSIGNRYGVYVSNDLKNWKLESKGFAYRMKRIDNKLFISGMGSSNRVYFNNEYKVLKSTPHMFKDVNLIHNNLIYYTSKIKENIPIFESTSLYSILLSLHDGSFFASWWVFVNDLVSLLLILLLITGSLRWYKKRKRVF